MMVERNRCSGTNSQHYLNTHTPDRKSYCRKIFKATHMIKIAGFEDHTADTNKGKHMDERMRIYQCLFIDIILTL